MAFDPDSIPEDAVFEGHLGEDSLVDLLRKLQASNATGCLSIRTRDGEDQMFFMRGQPVGVKLAEYLYPLGQLLLELGLVDASTFIKAQRIIKAGNRLPGRVFQELGVIDDKVLKKVLDLQTRRKAEHFCSLRDLGYSFGKGLTYLTGFNSAPLDVNAVIFLALRHQLTDDDKHRVLDRLADRQLLLDPGRDPLPAPLQAFGFGKAEERFLARLQSGWQDTQSLAETGTLPADEVAVLLHFLDILGRLHKRPRPGVASRELKRPAELEATSIHVEKTQITKEPPEMERRVPADVTDPGIAIPDDIHNEPTDLGNIAPIVRKKPRPVPDSDPRRKKKVRRKEPLPSLGVSAVSVTKKEKTEIGPLPTIVIDDE